MSVSDYIIGLFTCKHLFDVVGHGGDHFNSYGWVVSDVLNEHHDLQSNY